ncbi:hypothetical protein CCC_02736 [Paramagnetospirillum magnetotacticum MS-1]|uniref:Uncharacterized protein n=1 Tax=Paramagnetospirillum magnetotacticum MS-1 TaxID=272627 RepID=A0A0C2UEL8_PARME|nr:hypothetical protein [Paramagnetospirillum magnetotacticum]KIL99947.1 hypothetical protein CCC_02736 [Paramagnetospirillum magnetotacticum MS-1]
MKRTAGAAAKLPHSHNDAVRVINDTLKGRVAEVFRALIPAFEGTSGEEFYDLVMANSEMLHGCISIFRRNRSAFRNLLVDARGRPVNDDFVALRCGRSVHDVIAMIVRTHAKRHFKATLGGDPNDPKSKAGAMYKAINEYLIHDWQVPLVPHYAPLPLAKVQEMGPRLLDIREAEILDSITAAAAAPSLIPLHAPRPPSQPDLPQREQLWWTALNDTAVIKVLGTRPESETRELVAALGEINDLVHADLFARLNLSTFQAAIAMVTAYKLLGRAGFRTQFGIPGKPAVVAAIALRLDKREVGSHTDLKAMPQLMEAALRG